MAFGIRITLMGFVLGVGLWAAPLSAQTYYRGYDIGPDYGAMVQEQLRRGQMLQQQMQHREQQVIAQVMQDPRFQALYQQHRAQGGQMSPQQFAYAYAATGGFTPQGLRNFRQSESANAQREAEAYRRLREAEAARGGAQMDYSHGYQRNNQEFGNMLRGNSTYVAPGGQSYVLPHTQPGVVQRDPSTGNAFVMDNLGQYYIHTPYGWQPMRPAH